MKFLLAFYNKQSWEVRIAILAALVTLPALMLVAAFKGDETPVAEEGVPQVDTLIPRGFVLVPIEVVNYEALDSILGRFGVVDLMSASRLVARNVRILRAPQNPSHFAVLVRENEVDRILRHGQAFTVIIKPPQQTGTEFVNTPDSAKRKIVYEGG